MSDDGTPSPTTFDQDFELTIDEWSCQEKDIIDQFAEDWKKNRDACPSQWPEKLTPRMWDQQFRIFHDETGE